MMASVTTTTTVAGIYLPTPLATTPRYHEVREHDDFWAPAASVLAELVVPVAAVAVLPPATSAAPLSNDDRVQLPGGGEEEEMGIAYE